MSNGEVKNWPVYVHETHWSWSYEDGFGIGYTDAMLKEREKE